MVRGDVKADDGGFLSWLGSLPARLRGRKKAVEEEVSKSLKEAGRSRAPKSDADESLALALGKMDNSGSDDLVSEGVGRAFK